MVERHEYSTISERIELMRWYDHVVWVSWCLLAVVSVPNTMLTSVALFVATMLFQRAYYMRHRDHLLKQVG